MFICAELQRSTVGLLKGLTYSLALGRIPCMKKPTTIILFIIALVSTAVYFWPEGEKEEKKYISSRDVWKKKMAPRDSVNTISSGIQKEEREEEKVEEFNKRPAKKIARENDGEDAEKPADNGIAADENTFVSDDELDRIEAQFEELEKNWSSKMTDLITEELGLPKETLEQYRQLRDEYEERKVEALEEYHEYMEEKYGENYNFDPKNSPEPFENNVKSLFEEQLKSMLGQDGYSRYSEMRERFNEDLSHELDPALGSTVIEL